MTIVHQGTPENISVHQSAPNHTQAGARASRVHQIVHMATPEHSECTK